MPARAPIQAPRPQPIRTGLIGTVGRTEIPAERWQWGVSYRPRRYDAGRSYDSRACAPQSLDVSTHPAEVSWDAYAIWWGEQCTLARPSAFDQLRSDALANLDVHASHLIEQILWTGKVDGAAYGPPNVGLIDAPTILAGGAPMGVVDAWRRLLDHLATCLAGARGMIHVPHRALAQLDYYGLVVREGTLVMAATADHLVVAGTGYTGSGPGDVVPAGNDVWFFGTSPIEVRLGPAEATGDPSQTLDRQSDEIEIRAWQPALAHWDRQCHAGVRVCLEDPGPACGGS
jgi:hypothetical protein